MCIYIGETFKAEVTQEKEHEDLNHRENIQEKSGGKKDSMTVTSEYENNANN